MNDTHAVLLLSKQIGRASISAVLKFRKALTFTQKRFPFSFAFGPAYSREACIESSQAVYGRLLLGTPSETVLPFETLALLALSETSEINQEKAKDLVKLFRPDRQGYLTVLDFVKSVDSVYKEFRLLSASIETSSRIDLAFEAIFNCIFNALVATMILIQLEFDPLALFLSLSGVILAFAFIIGSASAKYFEGLLFILVRRPYGIGDMIHISNVEKDTNSAGSPGWVSHAVSSRVMF
jgi:small-conductance mechanosensitive channel